MALAPLASSSGVGLVPAYGSGAGSDHRNATHSQGSELAAGSRSLAVGTRESTSVPLVDGHEHQREEAHMGLRGWCVGKLRALRRGPRVPG